LGIFYLYFNYIVVVYVSIESFKQTPKKSKLTETQPKSPKDSLPPLIDDDDDDNDDDDYENEMSDVEETSFLPNLTSSL
jgi:hypothetical protein